MEYLEIEVKTAFIVHGFDENNREIVENVNEPDFMKKLVSIERIQSVSEQYLLVAGSHGRMMYWEYKGSMAELKERLSSAGIRIV
jgi:hypothetical protein